MASSSDTLAIHLPLLIAFICLALPCGFITIAAFWISTLPFSQQLPLGIVVGLASIIAFCSMQLHRSQQRQRRAVNLVQLALADIAALRRLLPHKHVPGFLSQTSGFDKVRWINAELVEIWPFLKEAISGILALQLQSTLDQYKFGVVRRISITSLNLGTKSPYIDGIKVAGGGQDEIILEAQLDWRRNREQQLILDLQTTGPDFTVQVKDFVIYAVIRLTFKPLREDFPGFGAVVFSLTETPLVDFQTKFLSGDVATLPGVRKAVDNVLITALMDLLVWPSRLVLPVVPGDYSYLEIKPMGYLHVELLEAKDLLNKVMVGKSDPFVILYVRRRQDGMKESKRMHDTASPVWNEQFTFNVEDPEVQTLTVRVMDVDTVSLADYIGSAELPINQFGVNVKNDIWVDLAGDPKKLRGKCPGRVHVLIEYKPIDTRHAVHQEAKTAAMEVNQSKDLPFVEGNSKSLEVVEPGVAEIFEVATADDMRDGRLTDLGRNAIEELNAFPLSEEQGTSEKCEGNSFVNSNAGHVAVGGLENEDKGCSDNGRETP